jgi:hypothetical protein
MSCWAVVRAREAYHVFMHDLVVRAMQASMPLGEKTSLLNAEDVGLSRPVNLSIPLYQIRN